MLAQDKSNVPGSGPGVTASRSNGVNVKTALASDDPATQMLTAATTTATNTRRTDNRPRPHRRVPATRFTPTPHAQTHTLNPSKLAEREQSRPPIQRDR